MDKKQIARDNLKIYLDPKEVYSIGVHICGIRHDIKPSEELISSILNNGLFFRIQEGAGLTGTTRMLGSKNYEEKLDAAIDNLYDDVDSDNKVAGVIVAIPGSIKDLDGEDYFIGTYPDDLNYIAKDDIRVNRLPIEQFSLREQGVPKELILGVICKVDGETIVCGNNEFISYQDLDKQADFLDRMRRSGSIIRTVAESKKNYSGVFARIYGEGQTNYLSEAAIQYAEDKAERIKKYEKDNMEYQEGRRR